MNVTNHSSGIRHYTPQFASFPPIECVHDPMLCTNQAAHYLMRRPQTLRVWACLENGPIRPIRINGRLAWRTNEIKTLLGVA